MSPRLITYSSTISCSIAVGNSWSRVDTGGLLKVVHVAAHCKYLNFKAVTFCSQADYGRQGRNRIWRRIHQEGLQRFSFQFLRVDKLLLYLCNLGFQKLTLFIRLRHGRQWRDLLARVQSGHEEVRAAPLFSQSILYWSNFINKKRWEQLWSKLTNTSNNDSTLYVYLTFIKMRCLSALLIKCLTSWIFWSRKYFAKESNNRLVFWLLQPPQLLDEASTVWKSHRFSL